MWDSAEDMPAEAPMNHDGLSKDAVRTALGVWVNEKQQLIAIRQLD
ncbi:hypothetical protein [Pseudoruegeria sp. HB172150]|nr:hypothetical protein [Pseudoruegeria sp. HB172150]